MLSKQLFLMELLLIEFKMIPKSFAKAYVDRLSAITKYKKGSRFHKREPYIFLSLINQFLSNRQVSILHNDSIIA